MKKILLLTYILLGVSLVGAQDTMYIMKDGDISAQYEVSTVDSLIFYAPTTTPISVAGVSVGPKTASLIANSGGTQQLIATVSPSGATNPSVTWVSSNNAVASVNTTTGLVTAGTTAGTATITATTADGGFTDFSDITVTTAPEPSSCLNNNQDFSAGLDGWATWTATGKTADYTVVSGELAVTNISGTTYDWETSLVAQYNFVQGKTYTLNFDARSSVARPITIAVRECNGAEDCSTTDNSTVINTTTSTQNFTYVFEQTEPTYVYGQLMFLLGANTNNVYFDNICITEGGVVVAPPVTCSLSSDFEVDEGGWVVSNSSSWGGSGNSTLNIVGGEAQITNITGAGRDNDISLVSGYNLEQNKTYVLSFDARTASVNKIVGITLRKCNNGSCTYEYPFYRHVEVNSTKTTYKVEYTHRDVTGFNNIMIQVGENNETIYLDNICLAEGTLPAPTPNGTTLNILPIGDSISQGGSGAAGAFIIPYAGTYRKELYYRLIAMGYDVNMIGTMNTLANSPADDPWGGIPDPNGYENIVGGWDQNSECYWGDRADQLLTYLNSNSASFETIPDIALIHIGTNDINHGQPLTAPDDIRGIIDYLRIVNPDIKIFLAQLIPIDGALNAQVNTLNTSIAGIVTEKNTGQSPVILVNQNTSLNVGIASDFEDPFHPTRTGAYKMGTKWLDAILASIP